MNLQFWNRHCLGFFGSCQYLQGTLLMSFFSAPLLCAPAFGAAFVVGFLGGTFLTFAVALRLLAILSLLLRMVHQGYRSRPAN